MWIIMSSFPLFILDPSQSKCQLARTQALEASTHNSGGHVHPAAAVFVPECHPDGHFLPVQCHNQTGYCWCSTADGKPVSGTSVLHVIPNCTGQIYFIQSYITNKRINTILHNNKCHNKIKFRSYLTLVWDCLREESPV